MTSQHSVQPQSLVKKIVAGIGNTLNGAMSFITEWSRSTNMEKQLKPGSSLVSPQVPSNTGQVAHQQQTTIKLYPDESPVTADNPAAMITPVTVSPDTAETVASKTLDSLTPYFAYCHPGFEFQQSISAEQMTDALPRCKEAMVELNNLKDSGRNYFLFRAEYLDMASTVLGKEARLRTRPLLQTVTPVTAVAVDELVNAAKTLNSHYGISIQILNSYTPLSIIMFESMSSAEALSSAMSATGGTISTNYPVAIPGDSQQKPGFTPIATTTEVSTEIVQPAADTSDAVSPVNDAPVTRSSVSDAAVGRASVKLASVKNVQSGAYELVPSWKVRPVSADQTPATAVPAFVPRNVRQRCNRDRRPV